jgi:hypothetical protein
MWRCRLALNRRISAAEYPLPGGPALCTHPTPIYRRFVLASQLDQAERRVEEAEADAAEANHQANMMSRNLQAANALAASYRQGLERIAEHPCDNNDTGDEPMCGDLDVDPCPSCIARSLLNPSSTGEGNA